MNNNEINQNDNLVPNNIGMNQRVNSVPSNTIMNQEVNTVQGNAVMNQTFNPILNNEQINMNNNTTPKSKKSNLKIILIILALIIIGVVVFFLLNKSKDNSSTSNLNSVFEPNKPIIVKNNGKYGYITSEGETMIEPQYNSATDFYGDYAVVSVDNSDPMIYNDVIYELIDKQGNVKITAESYYSPKYYSDFDLWLIDGALYDSKLNRTLDEGITIEYIDYEYFTFEDVNKNESGIMTYKGKKVFTIPETYIYVDISQNEYNEEDLYASVRTYGDNEKEVIISIKTGEILFTSEDVDDFNLYEVGNGIFQYYDSTLPDGYENRKYLYFIDNKLAYQTTDKVYDLEVYDYKNQILEIDYGYDYEELGKSQRIYYYDIKNKTMLEKRPSSSNSLDDLEINLTEQTYGFKEYSSSGKYGIMLGEKVIVPCEYDGIQYLDVNLFNYFKSKSKELVLLEKEGNLLLYDLKNSKTITTFNSSYINDYDNSTFIKYNIYENGEYMTKGYTVYNLLSGKSMNFELDNEISIGSNYIAVKKDNQKIYYNTDFKQIYVSKEI